MKSTRGGRPGFTLVEMLVAVALVLFILGLFATLMQSAMQGVRDAKGINAVDQKLRNAVTILKADLRQVYLANGGTRFSPAELFTRRDRIPTAGYFSIVENSHALPQGVDQFGNPVSLDYDDILAMTVARRGDSPSEMFYGRAATGYSTCSYTDPSQPLGTNNPRQIDVGIYLDNLWNSPAGRQDQAGPYDIAGNSLVTSRFAEVVYFVRPQGETPTLFELNADPWAFGNQGGLSSQTLPNLPRTFTLYRRQLLVLDDDALNRSGVTGVGPVLMPNGRSPYNFFDVSMTRELGVVVQNGRGVLQPWTPPNGNQNALHFNTLADLTRREFRYGMQPVFVTLPQPFDREPYQPGSGGPSLYSLTRTLRAYPLSHVDSTAANANPLPKIHDYYHYRDPSERGSPATTTANQNGSKLESWVGLPTLAESAHPNYPFWSPVVDDITTAPNLTMDAATGELAAYPAGEQRGGEDVLLRDVVSFDVKVLETLGGHRAWAADGSEDVLGVAPQAAGAGGQFEYHDLVNNNASTLYGTSGFPFQSVNGDIAGLNDNIEFLMGRRPQFVDLGYGADENRANNQYNYNNPTGGNDAAAGTINTLTVPNYLFKAPPAPSPPPNFTYQGVTYGHTAAYGTIPGGLEAAPFGFTIDSATREWVLTTPQSLLLRPALSQMPAPHNNSLMRGAHSPIGAPFGVPLDCRFWIAGSVGDASKQSDVYLGPDGKPGIAGVADNPAQPNSVDGGVLDSAPPMWGTTPGEYGGRGGFAGGRSDDLLIDPTFTPNPTAPATPGPNTFFLGRPGILGPDMALGERGNYDDGFSSPSAMPDSRDRVYPNSSGTQYSLGELFALGSDDQPFVGVPFRLSGQVAAVTNTLGNAKHHPFNLFNLNPRNTYDSWSGAGDLVNQYNANTALPTIVLPSYKASPVRVEQLFTAAATAPMSAAGQSPPQQLVEKSYIPEPDFRPAPYPRPVKAVQVKIRVLERRTGIVREATIRHAFAMSGTE